MHYKKCSWPISIDETFLLLHILKSSFSKILQLISNCIVSDWSAASIILEEHVILLIPNTTEQFDFFQQMVKTSSSKSKLTSILLQFVINLNI